MDIPYLFRDYVSLYYTYWFQLLSMLILFRVKTENYIDLCCLYVKHLVMRLAKHVFSNNGYCILFCSIVKLAVLVMLIALEVVYRTKGYT